MFFSNLKSYQMEMNQFIYLRGLKRVDHSVFCVAEGQKTYYDGGYKRNLPYSSGQQVKRSIMEAMLYTLNEPMTPVTFVYDVKDKKRGPEESEVLSLCDPTKADQLIGGWMSAESRRGAEAEKEKSRTLKRRSPLSISAMRPLHPLLGGISKENITFDRSERKESRNVIVRDITGKELNESEIADLISGTDRSLGRKWIPYDAKSNKNARATGLFVYEVAVDLRRLFAVSTDITEPEVNPKILKELMQKGWIESKNAFGNCLVAPKNVRDKIIPGLACALINWRITSNQARTFSLMETLGIAISNDANRVAAAIRSKLKEDEDKVEPIIDDTIPSVYTFISLPAAGYMRTTTEAVDALEKAEQKLIELMSNFNYEDQLQKASV